MDFTLHPWQLYFLILAGWVNRQQQTGYSRTKIPNVVANSRAYPFELFTGWLAAARDKEN